jgi:hypothetical protein
VGSSLRSDPTALSKRMVEFLSPEQGEGRANDSERDTRRVGNLSGPMRHLTSSARSG